MASTVIAAHGSQFVWACPTCGVASAPFATFGQASAAFTTHLEEHAAWAADEGAGFTQAECFERAMGRRAA